MPTLIVSQKIDQTPTHANNDNGVFQSIHLSYCSDYITDFDVTDDFYDFGMENLPLENDDDNIRVDAKEPMLHTI